MANDRKLLVIEPGVKLNGDAYKKLDEAGYVVVRGDPSQFHVIDDALHAGDGLLLACALKALRTSGFAMTEFSSHVVEELLKRRNLSVTSKVQPITTAQKPQAASTPAKPVAKVVD